MLVVQSRELKKMRNQKAEKAVLIIMCGYNVFINEFFWDIFSSTCSQCSHPISPRLKITLSASFPEDLELNRDFNGDDFEYEDEAKLVIFPDHFEIPLPNIEELPALVSGSVCSCALYALHAKGLICRFSFSACLSNITSLHFILSQMTLYFIFSLFILLIVCSDVMCCCSFLLSTMMNYFAIH